MFLDYQMNKSILATQKPRYVPAAYPKSPTAMPGPMTALLCSTLPITGAKGGEQMSAMLVVSVVSVSMRKSALNNTWKKSAPRVAIVVKMKMLWLISVKVFRLTCDATAMLKMRMK